MNVSLTPQLEKMVREKVESGSYNNASEVVRDGLRLIEQRDRKLEALRGLIQAGMDQIERGECVVADDAFFDSIDKEVEEKLAQEMTPAGTPNAQ